MTVTFDIDSVLEELEYMFHIAHDREPTPAEYGLWLLDHGPDGATVFLSTVTEEQIQAWRAE